MLSWDDIRAGDFVVVDAEDHYETFTDDAHERCEFPFALWGQVLQIDAKKIVIEGAWWWLCDEEWLAPEPEVSFGTFGCVRGAVNWIRPHPGPSAVPLAFQRARLLD